MSVKNHADFLRIDNRRQGVERTEGDRVRQKIPFTGCSSGLEVDSIPIRGSARAEIKVETALIIAPAFLIAGKESTKSSGIGRGRGKEYDCGVA